ncbi:HTH-type transcriptional regulator BetI (fragment) [Xanthomonas citri pv. citri]|uniref:HTH-type transcriptional regulator BetI n=1 Tax=Xanthomonas citri pv. citri TaxID=611301 RepID=A0A0U4YNZ2_XANCI
MLRRLQRQSPHLLRAGAAGADRLGAGVVAVLIQLRQLFAARRFAARRSGAWLRCALVL